MIVLLLALVAAPAPGLPVKALARGPWPYARWDTPVKGKVLVVRSRPEFVQATPYPLLADSALVRGERATRELLAALKVKSIDWDRQMVVVVCAGRKPSSGYRVKITGVVRQKDCLKVSWTLLVPKGGADDVLTYPSECVLLPKHTGKVVFDPPLGK
jgi:hypothetical protein